MCCSDTLEKCGHPLYLGPGEAGEAVSSAKLFLQVVLSAADGNGNEVKWSEKLESLTFSALGSFTSSL